MSGQHLIGFKRRGPVIGVMLAVLILLVVGTLVFAVMSGIETEWKLYSILAVVFASIASIIAIVFTIYYFATSKSLDKFSAAYNRRVDAIGKAMTEAARRARATGQAVLDYPGLQFNKAVINALQSMSPEQQAVVLENIVKKGNVLPFVSDETKTALMQKAAEEEVASPEARQADQRAVNDVVAIATAVPPPPQDATAPAPAAAAATSQRPYKAGLNETELARCNAFRMGGAKPEDMQQAGCY